MEERGNVGILRVTSISITNILVIEAQCAKSRETQTPTVPGDPSPAAL